MSNDIAAIKNALLEAEMHHQEPTIVLFKTRFIGEALAQLMARSSGLSVYDQEPQIDLINRLSKAALISNETAGKFHRLRTYGNAAIHNNRATPAEATASLRIARELISDILGNKVPSARRSAGRLIRPASLRDWVKRLRA